MPGSSGSRTANVRTNVRRLICAAAAIGTLAVPAIAVSPAASAAVDTSIVAPVSLFAPASANGAIKSDDRSSVELGVRFTTSTAGTVTAIKYYKPLGSYGQKTGHLWSASGTLLGAVTFGNESASGWQQAKLDTPVNLAANKTYTVSYLAPRGGYAATVQYFWGRSVVSGPLTAVAQSNGVYSYSRRATFPNQTYWKSPNYWVDVVFVPQAGSDTSSQSTSTQPPVTTTQPPVTTTQPPVTTTQPPVTTTQPPVTTTQPPVTTTQPPVPTQPVPSTGKNCVVSPHECGFPDATNTGPRIAMRSVPAQVTSGPGWHYDSRGWVVIDGTNAQVSGLAFTVDVSIEAAGVKLSDCEVRKAGSMFPIAVRHAPNTTIDHCRITSPGANNLVGIKDIYGDSTNLTITNNDIGRASTGVQMESGLVQGNYIHDIGLYDAGSHLNGFTSNGGTRSVVVRHNTILVNKDQTDAVSFFQDFGTQANKTIDNNLLAGGGYTIYGGAGNKGATSNIKITNNRISSIYFAKGGYWGWLAHFTPSDPGNLASGNVWDATGSPIS